MSVEPTSVGRSRMAPVRPRSIVVGYDKTRESEAAITWALRRAGRRGRVVLVHGARHEPTAHGEAVTELPFLERDEIYDFDVITYVSDAAASEAILCAARDHEADEIAVGHRPRSGLRSLSGSVCAELLSHSPVPVTVVPASATHSVVDVSRPTPPTVVVGYSGDDGSRAALHWAMTQTDPGSRIVLVCALGHENGPLPGASLLPAIPGEAIRNTERVVREWVEDGEGIGDVLDFHLTRGEPSELLTDMAEKTDAEMIVVGHRHGRRLERARASVARDLLANAPCPVVVVP